MQVTYHCRKDWPPLSWLAKCSPFSSNVHVYHGSNVEVFPSWFCEAVWDGPFPDGDFDLTDVVFGSGARIREEELIFVSSGSTVDRLQYLKFQDLILVSNSLVCLLKAVDATVDITYPRYFEDFETICHGIQDYKRTLETSVGQVNFLYFNNYQWDGEKLIEVEKPSPVRDFRSFPKYQGFLESSLYKVSQNGAATERNTSYEFLATLSGGYDTSAVVVLAQRCDLQEVLSIKSSRTGLSDNGQQLAQLLGLQQSIVERHAWQSKKFPEVLFIASDAKGEDVYFGGAGNYLTQRVLLTGYTAGGFWLKGDYPLNEHLLRGDQSGLSLTEFRLEEGFIHLPVPFLGAKQVQDILAISMSPEMAPWDIGGDYNRPIQRRLVEEAGVPRYSFATVKNAASVLLFERKSFLSQASLADYHQWLQRHAYLWWKQNKLPPRLISRLRKISLPVVILFVLIVRIIAKVTPPGPLAKLVKPFANKVKLFARKEYLFKFVFPWALEKAKLRYSATSLFQENLGKEPKTR